MVYMSNTSVYERGSFARLYSAVTYRKVLLISQLDLSNAYTGIKTMFWI